MEAIKQYFHVFQFSFQYCEVKLRNFVRCLLKVMLIFALLGSDGIIADSVDGPCRSGNFFLSALPKTNLYLLVIENWSEYRQSYFYNFNCHISNRVFDAGAFRIVNGTCAHIETQTSLKKKEKCPALKNVHMKCSYNVSSALTVPSLLQLFVAALIIMLKWSWFI